MDLTLQKIEDLAPDQTSFTAAQKLLKPAKWPLLALNDGPTLIWGECQGSGSTPYRVTAALDDQMYLPEPQVPLQARIGPALDLRGPG